NHGSGVGVSPNAHVRITANSIHDNGRLGIDLASRYDPASGVTRNDTLGHSGPNNFQDFPVLTSARTSGSSTTIAGTLDSGDGGSFTIEFFSSDAADPSGYGEGQVYLGKTELSADAGQQLSFTVTLPVSTAGKVISATATDGNGNTSEFSAAVAVTNV